jgi:hypothetical protein
MQTVSSQVADEVVQVAASVLTARVRKITEPHLRQIMGKAAIGK